jgi:hypothetical protein
MHITVYACIGHTLQENSPFLTELELNERKQVLQLAI